MEDGVAAVNEAYVVLEKRVTENASSISQTAEQIRSEVNATSQILTQKVETDVGTAKTELGAKIEADIGAATTATNKKIDDDIAAAKSALEEKIAVNSSSITQTATEIRSEVSQQVTSLNNSIDSLDDDIYDLTGEVDSVRSVAEQAADHFSWIVESGTSASRMTLTDEFLEIVSDNITIKADIDLYGFMTVWRTDAMSSRGGYIGYSTGDDGVNASTSGCAVSSTDRDHYLLATNSGIRMTADTNAVVVMDSQISATEEISISSDERVKNSISYDMDKYDAFFEKLKPSFYRYNAGQSGRFHVGFIAQDVEQAIKEGGITTQDFAGLIQLKEKAEMLDGYEDQYYLRYENFIALNTHMIQKLMARVTELENKLEALS